MKFNKFILISAICMFIQYNAKSQQWNGLTLYSNSNSTLGYLLDTASTVVKTFTFNSGTGYSTHMMPGGTIYRSVQRTSNFLTGGGVTGRMQKVDYNGNVLWDYVYSSTTYVLHHDHCVLPNGNILVISYEVKTPADVAAAGATNSITVWSEKIMEWEPVGTNSVNVVWEWHLWDHLVQNLDSTKANYKSSIVNNPQLMNINRNLQKDWFHMNGIDYNPLLDQIVVSAHNTNEWYIIDHSTNSAEAADHSGGLAGKGGDFLYRWGNPSNYQASGSTILNVTHDAHWVPLGSVNEGYLSGINNRGVTNPSNKTTADQISPPRSGLNYTRTTGSAYTPATYAFRHQSTGYTSNMGSVDEFPNGNKMVCLATAGLIYEIDPAGTTLWSKSTAGMTPQSHRYTQCYIDFTAPAQPSISVTNSVLISTSANTYQWYLNGNVILGATGQSLIPTQSGAYVVEISDQNNCVKAYSALFTYTVAVVDPVGLIEQTLLNDLQVYPNPGSGQFQINSAALNLGDFTLSIYDISGKCVLVENNSQSFDLSSFQEGMYTLVILTEQGQSIRKKIILNK